MSNLFTMIRNQLPLTAYAYKGETVPCNLCGSDHALTICTTDRRLKPLRTIACEQCGLIRTDPMPTDAELDAYYAGEYRLDYQFALSRKPPQFHINRSRREAEDRYALLKPALTAGRRILDFGSGSGEFLALAARDGHDVRGIEPGESFARHARETYGVSVDTLTWQQARLAPGGFDLITANHVIEHLREPVTALKQIATWLADDGVLHVSVPNALGRRRYSFQHFHFAHVYTFTPQALIWAGLLAGLEPDPRFENAGTTIIFRKRPGGAAMPDWGQGEGRRVAAHFEPASAMRFLLSGRWAVDAVQRLGKVLRDGRKSRPRHPAGIGQRSGQAASQVWQSN